jgi:hypothetical protein
MICFDHLGRGSHNTKNKFYHLVDIRFKKIKFNFIDLKRLKFIKNKKIGKPISKIGEVAKWKDIF